MLFVHYNEWHTCNENVTKVLETWKLLWFNIKWKADINSTMLRGLNCIQIHKNDKKEKFTQ